MTVTITAQTVITAFALVGAVVGLTLYFVKAVRWFDKQKKMEAKIKVIETKHTEDIKSIQKELSIITQANLACLKGLQEKGCNGPVTAAITMVEDFLNEAAHEQ